MIDMIYDITGVSIHVSFLGPFWKRPFPCTLKNSHLFRMSFYPNIVLCVVTAMTLSPLDSEQ